MVESQSTKEEQFADMDGKMVTVTICDDCRKDLDPQGKYTSALEEFGVPPIRNNDF